tara:strand:- start:1773 stop:2453 length:681 start_codon:yes stop_codon:yes gene_type:complete
MKQIILIILVVIIVYFLIKALFSKNKLLSIGSAISAKSIDKRKIKTSTDNYYFSFWYNINDFHPDTTLLEWVGNTPKGGVKPNKKTECSGASDTKLSLKLNGKTAELKVTTDSKMNNPHSIPDIPLGGWNNIIVSASNNYIDVYINGELYDTLPGQLEHTKGCRLRIGPYHGHYGNIKFDKISLSMNDVRKIYYEGLGQNPIKKLANRYRLELSINDSPYEKNIQL